MRKNKLWISASIWHQAIEIWRILPAVRILRTHPDRFLNSSWHCVLSRSFLNKWAFLKSAQKLKWQKFWRQFKLCHFNSLHLETDGMSGATLHFQVSLSLRVAFYFFLCARSAWESSCSSGNTVNGFLRALDWRLWSLWVILASDRQTIPFLLQYTQPPGYTCTTDHVVRRFYL